MVEVKQRGSANETKEEIPGQEEEMEEDKDVSSDERLPISPDFEFEYAVKYEIDNHCYKIQPNFEYQQLKIKNHLSLNLQ